jgi:pimeloyl-ACP methyl ester carboxylesterase
MMPSRMKDSIVRVAWAVFAITAWFAREPLFMIVANAADTHPAMRAAVYGCVYVLMAGFAVPGAVLLTILAGPLFGRSTNAKRFLLPLFVLVFFTSGCASHRSDSSLAAIYNPLAQRPDYERNPVIVIPGVLGSRLVDDETGKTVWGEYDRIRLRRRQADDLAAVAHPMGLGVPLSQLRDGVRSDGTLAYLELKIGGIPVELQAYNQILQTLGVGGYRDADHPKSGGVDYGEDHFTCFQFDYDWRRDIAENAALLDQFIAEKREYIRAEYETRYGIVGADIKFDIVAHSLGGLVSRYYLRYGSQQLPDDGSLPPLDWAGAESVERVVLVGTPNAGSAFSLRDLVNGHQLSRVLPYYPPAALGTMPSIYQMLPRPRHQTLVDAQHPDQAIDFYDPQLWQRMKWGLADPNQDEVLQELLPEVTDRMSRECIALDHQQKCLLKAKQLHQALDIPAAPPPGVTLHLYAGDAIETPAVMSVDTQTGKLEIASQAPGDGTTTRHSALMSEQPVLVASTRPSSPIHWTSVMFLHTSHRKLTSDPVFTDNVLALLLQSPRR